LIARTKAATGGEKRRPATVTSETSRITSGSNGKEREQSLEQCDPAVAGALFLRSAHRDESWLSLAGGVRPPARFTLGKDLAAHSARRSLGGLYACVTYWRRLTLPDAPSSEA
jgi:hypothetical protein